MGSQSSGSSSRPLTAAERLDTYSTGLSQLSGDLPNERYQSPTQEKLTGGDYERLQSQLEQGYTAPINRAKAVDLQAADQEMSDRGIYTSLNAIRGRNDVSERYIPQFAAAGANATNARYNLQSNENAQTNAFNADQAQKKYDNAWRPADYKAGLWNGTGGTISSGSSGGWSI